MHEGSNSDTNRAEYGSFDERLASYYGPELPPQPLAPDSWLQLRSQLTPRRPARRRLHWPRIPRLRPLRRSGSGYYEAPSAPVQTAFRRILIEARVRYPPSMLVCRSKRNLRAPQVHVRPLGRRKIKLLLPSAAVRALEPDELDVLLATGLARYLCRYTRGATYATVCLFASCAALIAGVVSILLGIKRMPVLVIPIAIMVVALMMIYRQWRSSVFRADELVVLWLGRSAACQGLHGLAGRSRRSRGSRRAYAKGWGVSYGERIERVCGTHVVIEDERLTLVR